jgi:hypothetical protein
VSRTIKRAETFGAPPGCLSNNAARSPDRRILARARCGRGFFGLIA